MFPDYDVSGTKHCHFPVTSSLGEDMYMDDRADEDDEEGELEGYAGPLNDDSDYALEDAGDDDGHALGSQRNEARPTFFSRTTNAAERAALRTQVNESGTFLLDEDNEYLHQPTSRVPGTFGRRKRSKGEEGEPLPAYHKKISADLDSDDELGFSDRQISDKLAKDGRIRYDQKSISTRIGRIRLAKGDQVDFLLEEGYKEWQYDDDVLLMKAYELANSEVDYEIARIRACRFRKVSERMRRLDQDAIFSAKACTARYQALMNGTAKIPSDMDDNPSARLTEMEAFRTERESIRQAEHQEKEEKMALQRKDKNQVRLQNIVKAFKAEKLSARRVGILIERAAKAMVRVIEASEEAALSGVNKQVTYEREKLEMTAFFIIDGAKRRERNRNATFPIAHVSSLKAVTADTVDPRVLLSLENLQTLCEERLLVHVGKNEHELVQCLRDADDEYSLNDIKNLCRAKGLNTAGNRAQLKHQLALADTKKFAPFNQEGTTT